MLPRSIMLSRVERWNQRQEGLKEIKVSSGKIEKAEDKKHD